MKVILKETLDNLGTVGDIVSVKEGYGRNYLIPRGMAILADPKQVKAIEHHKRALETKRRRELTKAEELAKELANVEIVFARKTSDQDHLFGSVTTHDIEEAIQKKSYTSVTRKMLVLDQPIKHLGEHTVTVRLPGGLKTKIKVTVTKDEEA